MIVSFFYFALLIFMSREGYVPQPPTTSSLILSFINHASRVRHLPSRGGSKTGTPSKNKNKNKNEDGDDDDDDDDDNDNDDDRDPAPPPPL